MRMLGVERVPEWRNMAESGADGGEDIGVTMSGGCCMDIIMSMEPL